MDKRRDIILVTGATGQQGGAVARHLLNSGCTVRAMTRKPDSEAARSIGALGAEVVQGDLNDPASIERALAGAWGTFAVQNTWEAGVEGEEEQGRRFAEVARRAGIQHYVYASVGSAHRQTGIPHFDNKWRVEETIRGLGFPSYTVLRAVFFMENFLSPWFKPALDQGQLTLGIRPETRLQMIAVDDIGRFGLAAFERHDELNGEGIDIAGDERTMPETAEILGRALGRPVEFTPTPIEQVRAMSADFAAMLEWFDAVGYDADIAGLERRFGLQLTRLPEWASRNVAAQS
jgi:uncharacterized protein YbjT (DUF2867 family)